MLLFNQTVSLHLTNLGKEDFLQQHLLRPPRTRINVCRCNYYVYYDFIFIIASHTNIRSPMLLFNQTVSLHFANLGGGEDFLTSLPPATTALYLIANLVLVIYSDNTKRIVRSSFLLVFWGDYLIATVRESSANGVFVSGLRDLKLRARRFPPFILKRLCRLCLTILK